MNMVMKYTVIIAVMLLAVSISACSTPTPHERLLSHQEKIISLLEENKEDIPAAAKAVKSYVDGNIEEITKLAEESLADAKNPVLTDSMYVDRTTALLQKHLELETGYVLLLNDPGVMQALAPISEVFETSKAAGAESSKEEVK
ncbi:MAG: hypothetical protein JW904_04945 [Spirochaetales bacterium]|nr:hypothetical protein [Spirochaetales bacterium]